MAFTMDDIVAIAKPHADKIVAEHKLECALRENARLRGILRAIVNITSDAVVREQIKATLPDLMVQS